jgi:hypothetical protein
VFKHALSTILLLSIVCSCDAPPDETCHSPAAADAATDRPHAPGLSLVGPEIADDPEVAGTPDEISFREMGPPEGWYITTWNGQKIHTAEFVSAVISCLPVADPQWSCTLSWYQPDTAKPTFVGGLGCSAYFTMAYKDCLAEKWKANGAIKIQ